MTKRREQEIRQSLENINWDFEDYSSAKYPLDINSIPWYPATFPAPIPKYLVALLSESGDIVLDPFGGKGTTAVEALKQRRRFIYNDLNPHAVLIVQCILEAITQPENDERLLANDRLLFEAEWAAEEIQPYEGKTERVITAHIGENFINEIENRGIQRDVIFWFHEKTLRELVLIYDHIQRFVGVEQGIRKLAFISILKDVNSQRGHFSYITDNCRPPVIRYYNAFAAYLDMVDRIQRACADFRRQYHIINKTDDLRELTAQCRVRAGDARDCAFIEDGSVDLVITSPPYLCAQDYILTMRLNDFFFPDDGFVNLPFEEIGPRRLRTRASIVEQYFRDMHIVIEEIYRVLKDDTYFCLVIGKGKGKISKGIDVIKDLLDHARRAGFTEVFQTTRNISYRTNRLGGVDKEDIIVFHKRAGRPGAGGI